MKSETRTTLAIVSLSVVATAGCMLRGVDAESTGPSGQSDPHAVTVAPEFRIRSITFSSYRPPEPGTLESLRDVGVSHVTLIPFGYQRDLNGTEIRFDPDRHWYTESDTGIVEIAARARALDMATVLKPHIWVGRGRGTGQRRDQIGFENEARWIDWQDSYRRFILHYGRLAQRIDADVFVIGTELATAAKARPDYWRSLVEEIRTIYDGELSYAANWYDEYEHIQFWRSLDYVGVQAYFPISDRTSPSPDDLRAGWTRHLQSLSRVSGTTGRPVFFTEIGYRSVTDASSEPWRWALRGSEHLETPDLQMQADLYQAFFEEVWHQEWFAGASIWRWHTASESGTPVRAVDFTPQGKPALDIIRAWYTNKSSAKPTASQSRTD